jgi:hypothetical protein
MDNQDTLKTYFTDPSKPEPLVNDIKQMPKPFSKKRIANNFLRIIMKKSNLKK